MLKKVQEQKPYINVVVIGNVDTGKSKLISHLLFKCGGVDKRQIEKYEAYARENKTNYHNMYDWALSWHQAHRENENTLNVGAYKFYTMNYNFTIFDTPGISKYFKNRIIGISQSDVAILVISAIKSEFDAGFNDCGVACSSTIISFAYGIKQMIIVVNKMDSEEIKYDEQKFNELASKTKNFLKKIGYNPDKIPIIPFSAIFEDNLLEPSIHMPWYKGPTLIQALDALTLPVKIIDKPLRISVYKTEKISGIGTVVLGKVLTGVLEKGSIATFCPSSISAIVADIEQHHETIDKALPGYYIGFNVKAVNRSDIKRGDVCGNRAEDPPERALSFEAQIIIISHPGKIYSGYTPIMNCHTCQVACKFEEIRKKVDRKTGNDLEISPKFLIQGDSAIVKLVPQKPICVEPYSVFPALGRFVIRDISKIIGVGIVKSVEKWAGYEKTYQTSNLSCTQK